MYLPLSSSALLFLPLLGALTDFSREELEFQQQNNSLPSNDLTTYDLFLLPPKCGVFKNANKTHRIFGDKKVAKGEFSWMVAFLPLGCGGSLINARWVLTAGHCFYDINPSLHQAFVGSCCDANALEFGLDNVIVHEEYDNQGLDNDIAIVQLNGSVIFTDEIQPICLPYNNEAIDSNIVDKEAIISGWGLTPYGLRSDYLLKATVYIWSRNKSIDDNCVHEHHMCGKGIRGINVCYGDSGGPLFLLLHSSKDDGNKYYFQVGINSFVVKEGCLVDAPAGFTNVTAYIPWIRENILAN